MQELVPNIRYCAYNIGDESAMDDLRQMRIKTGGKEDALSSRLDVRYLFVLYISQFKTFLYVFLINMYNRMLCDRKLLNFVGVDRENTREAVCNTV